MAKHTKNKEDEDRCQFQSQVISVETGIVEIFTLDYHVQTTDN